MNTDLILLVVSVVSFTFGVAFGWIVFAPMGEKK